MRLVTNGWGFSTCGFRGDIEINAYKLHEGVKFKDGKFRFQKGDCYGTKVKTHAEADAVGLLHGYLKPYSRNTIRFVMSRAARKRGMTTADYFYNRRAAIVRSS